MTADETALNGPYWTDRETFEERQERLAENYADGLRRRKVSMDKTDRGVRLRAILDAINKTEIVGARIEGGGSAANEWIDIGIGNRSLILGYPEDDQPLAFNVLDEDGDSSNNGNVSVGDDPEAVANWVLGFVAHADREPCQMCGGEPDGIFNVSENPAYPVAQMTAYLCAECAGDQNPIGQEPR